jgi:hypothetical protein
MKKLPLVIILPIIIFLSSCSSNENQVDERSIDAIIDHSKTMEDLLLSSNYYYIHLGGTADQILPKEDPNNKAVVKTVAYLLRFHKSVTSEEVLAEMKNRNMRPGTGFELASLGAQYSNLKTRGIFAFGSSPHTIELLETVSGRDFYVWKGSDTGMFPSTHSYLAYKE